MKFIKELILNYKKLSFYKDNLLATHIPLHIFFSKISPSNAFFKTPFIVDFDITSRCTLHCSFCYVRSMINQIPDLSTNEIIQFIETLPINTYLFLGGGEPLMREDIFEMISYAKAKRLKTGICTNGQFLNVQRCKDLLETNIDSIFVSLHGNKFTHGHITGKHDSYDIALNNVKQLLSLRSSKNTRVFITNTMDPTQSDDLYDFLVSLKGIPVDGIKLEHLHYIPPTLKNEHMSLVEEYFPKKSPVKLRQYGREAFTLLCTEKFIQNIEKLPNRRILIKPSLSPQEIKEWYTGNGDLLKKRKCFYLCCSTYIAPDGIVHPCQFYEYPLGNIRDTPLSAIWKSKKYAEFRRIIKKGILPGCHHCCKT